MEISRRRLLQAAATASAAAAAGALSIGSAPAAAPQPSAAPAKLGDIDHIVILMKENRSFDHYFGTLGGVRGFGDAGADTVFRQPDGEHPDGYVLPFHLDTFRTNAQRLRSLNHGWGAQHASWNKGAMNNWIAAHRPSNGARSPLTMGYLTREDLPFYYALADSFTICDGYHCSLFGPTHPNRFYLMTGTLDPEGAHGGPAIVNDGAGYSWETYPERLQRAGISWRIYHDRDDDNYNVTKFFAQFAKAPPNSALYDNAMRDRPFGELLRDLRSGNLPQVSWIVGPASAMEHPAHLPAAGEHHTHQILDALWSNPSLWAKTALIINYDENDGQFDHVAPPVPEPGTPGEYVRGLPIGLGFRVPCLVISPFSRGGYVSGATFDHTSTLRLIEARFGVEISNLSKWRRETCGDLTKAFAFGKPPRYDVPELPDTSLRLLMAELRGMTYPGPAVPRMQAMPRQENSPRPRLA